MASSSTYASVVTGEGSSNAPVPQASGSNNSPPIAPPPAVPAAALSPAGARQLADNLINNAFQVRI